MNLRLELGLRELSLQKNAPCPRDLADTMEKETNFTCRWKERFLHYSSQSNTLRYAPKEMGDREWKGWIDWKAPALLLTNVMRIAKFDSNSVRGAKFSCLICDGYLLENNDSSNKIRSVPASWKLRFPNDAMFTKWYSTMRMKLRELREAEKEEQAALATARKREEDLRLAVAAAQKAVDERKAARFEEQRKREEESLDARKQHETEGHTPNSTGKQQQELVRQTEAPVGPKRRGSVLVPMSKSPSVPVSAWPRPGDMDQRNPALGSGSGRERRLSGKFLLKHAEDKDEERRQPTELTSGRNEAYDLSFSGAWRGSYYFSFASHAFVDAARRDFLVWNEVVAIYTQEADLANALTRVPFTTHSAHWEGESMSFSEWTRDGCTLPKGEWDLDYVGDTPPQRVFDHMFMLFLEQQKRQSSKGKSSNDFPRREDRVVLVVLRSHLDLHAVHGWVCQPQAFVDLFSEKQ